jgi:hypothetical protein
MEPGVVVPPSEHLVVDPRGVLGVVRPPPILIGHPGLPLGMAAATPDWLWGWLATLDEYFGGGPPPSIRFGGCHGRSPGVVAATPKVNRWAAGHPWVFFF